MQKNLIFFVIEIGPNLASKIPQTNKYHAQYINVATSSLQQTEFSEEEFKITYFFLKSYLFIMTSLSIIIYSLPIHYDISENVVRKICSKHKKFYFIFCINSSVKVFF